MEEHMHLPQMLLFFFCCCCSCFCLMASSHGISTDTETLLIFKSMFIKSDPQNALLTWNSSTHVCSWACISCTKNRTHVSAIDLHGLGIVGTIPPHISNLSSLTSLNLSNNFFHGPIPPQLGQLSLLQDLILNRNELSGEIPEELGVLPNLLHLQLTENNFIGEIPSSVYNISSLVFFSVMSNRLVGELPPNIGAALPNLQEVYMAGNMFRGHIPRSFSNISSIRRLYLGSNRFSGRLPLLGRMHNLVMVNLAENNFSSTTEENIDVFNSLMNCTQLEILTLSSNRLAGQLPRTLANLSIHLREVCVTDNLLSGNFPEGMDRYQNLSVLSLLKNRFLGRVPRTIGLLPNLQKIHLDNNFFFGEIPDTFSNLTKLYLLTLSKNKFFGEIPKSLEECKRLTMLDLSRNMLSGSIPKEIFNLSGSMGSLNLAQNSLTGSLPTEVNILKMISFMDVSDNEISGEIPATIGGCSSLQNLIMARNKFEGPIPESIGRLKALESFDVSSNHLSGQIPLSLEELECLQTLNLSFNDLKGQVPMEGAFKKLSWEMLQGNNQLCSNGDRVAMQKLRLPKCTTCKKDSKATSLARNIAIPIVSCALLLCAVLCSFLIGLYIRKKRNVNRRGLTLSSFKGKHRKISYGEILSATNGFDPNNFIGKGAFGSVYRGVIGCTNEDGVEQGNSTVVAIKVIDQKQSKASKAFETECETLRNIRHRNLVKVITSCSSIDHSGAEFKAVLMEYFPNGSLDKWLHPETESRLSLSLIQRLNIAIDVAMAMDYLHHDCATPIAHCDLKPSNVLLHDEMSAHVADFGLARFLSQNSLQSQCSTVGLKGSVGYIAPEYGLGSKASRSGDAYSYGILLLEMFTGKKPTDDMFDDGLDLKKFSSAVYENRVLEIMDPKLLECNDDLDSSGSISMDRSDSAYCHTNNSSESDWQHRKEVCLEAIIRVGLSCAEDAPTERVNMREALTKMHGIKETLLQKRRD